jgi:hypothetical protein
MLTLMTFALGFFARPFGAIILGLTPIVMAVGKG